ncbi:MAG: hypothetical protein HWD61_07140 [Parachlamydiaceae bacterium]|nr:MAG: hypothetical protein HWD61_07140 [Parachlamydiaceae bacterium]
MTTQISYYSPLENSLKTVYQNLAQVQSDLTKTSLNERQKLQKSAILEELGNELLSFKLGLKHRHIELIDLKANKNNDELARVTALLAEAREGRKLWKELVVKRTQLILSAISPYLISLQLKINPAYKWSAIEIGVHLAELEKLSLFLQEVLQRKFFLNLKKFF